MNSLGINLAERGLVPYPPFELVLDAYSQSVFWTHRKDRM